MDDKKIKEYLTSRIYRNIIQVKGDEDLGEKLQTFYLEYDRNDINLQVEEEEYKNENIIRRSFKFYKKGNLVSEVVIFVDKYRG